MFIPLDVVYDKENRFINSYSYYAENGRQGRERGNGKMRSEYLNHEKILKMIIISHES